MPDPTSSVQGFINAEDGVRLFFTAIGEGKSVVVPLACWTAEFDVLAKGHRLVFYDPRNRGGSTPVEIGKISFENDVKDIEAIRKHFGLETMSLIGWSYFGGVVARYAMEFPGRVERLVMVCGPPIRRDPHSDKMNETMVNRINVVAPGFLQEAEKTLSEPETMRKFWEVLKQVRVGRNGLGPMRGDPSKYPNETPENVAATFNRASQTLGNWDWRVDAKRATSATLFVYGDADFLPAEAAQEWGESLPNVRVFKMEGVGHFPFLEDPEPFFGAIEGFLSEV